MPLDSSILSTSRRASHAHAFEAISWGQIPRKRHFWDFWPQEATEEVLELIRGQIVRVEKVIDRGEE
jgi:hypothetical protein